MTPIQKNKTNVIMIKQYCDQCPNRSIKPYLLPNLLPRFFNIPKDPIIPLKSNTTQNIKEAHMPHTLPFSLEDAEAPPPTRTANLYYEPHEYQKTSLPTIPKVVSNWHSHNKWFRSSWCLRQIVHHCGSKTKEECIRAQFKELSLTKKTCHVKTLTVTSFQNF